MKTAEKNRLEEIPMAPAKRRGKQPHQTNGTTAVQQIVELPPFLPQQVTIHVTGITGLIVHNWSQKAVGMMLGKQLGEASKGREKKNPFEDFKGSLYPCEVDGKQRYGVPAPAFKACAVTAANDVQMKMTTMRRAFHVTSYTVPIDASPIKEPVTEWDTKYAKELKPYHALGISMRMDIVRLATGVADIRFRGWWPKWSAKLVVDYNSSMITLPQLLNLFRAGGWGGGICEWRPSAPECKSGEFGRFDMKVA